ncbi:uncharacterized protein LOC131342184 isoform X1 [Hemibagrus wyckioides]|uniref:uncharacterized protein LOC131342184 isoform X1 n=1 Tax=Hemibagrus wyckioides TaxID=337641 RepID=UPI00266D6AAC|nr:uncharacterized protein LOC131342184 isoform X1 [Hemibagrus wyckioides]
MALLVLLFFFHLILDINSQYVPQPRLLVSPEVITVRGSVLLLCDVPHHVKVSQCFFYPEKQKTNLKLSPSCQLSVTGSELIMWTGRSSPGTLHIICYYTDTSGIKAPSPHSLPAPVTVMYQKPRLSGSHDDQFDEIRLVCEIPESESVTADFSCNLYTGENPQPYLNQRSKRQKSGKLHCIFSAQRNDVFNRLQSVKSSEVSCDYSLISDPTALSLMSDKYNLIPFIPALTQTSITEISTAGFISESTQTSITEKSTTGFFPTPTQTSITTEKSPADQKPILNIIFDDQLDKFTFLCEIPESESVTADFSCNLYTGENPQPYLKTYFQKRKSGKLHCIFSAQRNDVFNRLQSVKSSEVSCDYSLISDPTALSLMSDKYNMIHFVPTQSPTTEKSTSDATPTSIFTASSTHLITTKHITTHLSSEVFSSASSTTKEKTTSGKSVSSLSPTTATDSISISTTGSGNSTSGEKPRSVFILMLSATAVCVSLAGLMSFCLCWFIKKQKAERRKMDMTRDDEGVMMSMVNSNPSGFDAAGTYSLITSVPLPGLPLDPSGDVNEDSKKTEDDVYHMYCSIADTQAVTKDQDVSVYSLLQTH